MCKFNHVMLDLETMGKNSNSAIVSIGAVEFDIKTGKTGREFYSRVDLQSCLDIGLKVNASTIYWWLQQNDAARLELTKPARKLRDVLIDLTIWFGENKHDFYLWGNGARFDIGIIEDAYVVCGFNTPWNFRNEKDLRTITGFSPEIKNRIQTENTGVEHNPIDDCKTQIKYLYEINKRIKFIDND